MSTTASDAVAVAAFGALSFLGQPIVVWVTALSGISFFLLLPSERNAIQRFSMVVPSTVLTVFSTPTIARFVGLTDADHPLVAGFLGLVFIALAGALVKLVNRKGFLEGSLKTWLQKWLGVSNGK